MSLNSSTIARALVVAILTGLAACAGPGHSVDRGPEPPVEEVTDRTTKTQRVTRLFSEGISELARDLEDIRRYNDISAVRGFPRDLFRFVVVTCLNGRRYETEAASISESKWAAGESVDISTDFDCPAQMLPRLVDRLEDDTDARRSKLLDFLRTVDAFQKQRDQLQDRIQQVSRVIESNRRILADRRAELKNQRQQLEQRRAEFSRPQWNKLQSRLDAYSQQLNRLEEATDELAERSRRWPERIETLNHSAYFAVIDPLRE